MVPTYRAAAELFEKTRDLFPDMIYTSVSFVGGTALADELMLLGKRYATGLIVTQVVPAVDGGSSFVLDYKSALGKYFPGETRLRIFRGICGRERFDARCNAMALSSTPKDWCGALEDLALSTLGSGHL